MPMINETIPGAQVRPVPGLQIAGLVLFGIVAGMLAGFFPARRASNLNILEAIAYE